MFSASSRAAMKRYLASGHCPKPRTAFAIVYRSCSRRLIKDEERSLPTPSRSGCTPAASTACTE